MSFPDYVTKFRNRLVEIRTKYKGQTSAHLYQPLWHPMASSPISTSTPPVPFSSTDLLSSYSSDIGNRHQLGTDDGFRRQYVEVERDRRKSREALGSQDQRTSSRNKSRHRSQEKSPIDRDDRPPSIVGPRDKSQLPPTSNSNHFKPYGLRNGPGGGPLSGSSRDSGEDLIATGTNWPSGPSKPVRQTSVGSANNSSNPTPIRRPPTYGKPQSSTLPSGNNQKSKTSQEPKYPDPLNGASASFQSRISELSSMEIDTIRWEKQRKFKKKQKES